MEVNLSNFPEGTNLDEVLIYAEFVGRGGQVDPAMSAVLLKERVEREPTPELPKTESPPESSGPDKDESASGEFPTSNVPATGVTPAEDDADAHAIGEATEHEAADAEQAGDDVQASVKPAAHLVS